MKVAKHIEAIDNFVLKNLYATKPDLKKWETDKYLMDSRTVIKFWDMIEKAPSVMIFGDYDVDGICSSYILAKSIKKKFSEKNVKVRLPRRFSEGYGINKVVIDEIKGKMPVGSLIITVDNGIASADILEDLESQGYNVIVTDHHALGKNRIPNVRMVLDPSVPECASSFVGTYWCGAGVAYKLVEQMLAEEDAREMECYAGVATIADIMQLKEGNWALVKRTINSFRNGSAPQPLMLLLSMLGKDYQFATVETFSFYLCPAINSPGRMDDKGASKALAYFIAPTIDKAKWIVATNEQRKKIRDEQIACIMQKIYENGSENDCPIWVSAPNLHEGIVGLIASEIEERFHVPSIVLNEREDGTLKGSARTSGDVDIYKYLLSCNANYISVGGHKGAAGLKMKKEEFEKARKTQISKPDEKKEAPISIEKEEIPELLDELKHFEPFGEGNPTPVFSTIIDMKADKAKLVGSKEEHLLIEDIDKQFKITHFYHEPNDLVNKNHFVLEGTIGNTDFNGVETPTFSGNLAYDYEQEEHSIDLEK